MKDFIFTLVKTPKTMKKLILMAIFLFFGTSLLAQEAARMEFKTDVINYGEIKEGSNGLRTFELTNTGNAPLVITRASSSRGVSVPKKPEEPVMPGQRAEIQVKYDTSIIGPIVKTITVYSNADVPAKSLKIRGRVIED